MLHVSAPHVPRARALGVLCGFFALVTLGLSLADNASWSGYAYTLGLGVVASGLLTRARARGGPIARAGLALLVAVPALRLFTGTHGRTVTMTTTVGGSRWLGRPIDEGDAIVAGSRLLVAVGAFHDPDAAAVPAALRAAYAEMRAAEGDVPSPFLPTYLGLETPERSDVLVIEGASTSRTASSPRAPPKGALVFLHGFAGGFTLPCWQVAAMAAHAQLDTYCPSLGCRGDWWSPAGERTLRETVELVRARGITSIYLAGLSNGAVGAALLAPRMRGAFRGLVLVSGAARDAPAPGVPVLVVQGRRDGVMPPAIARQYAEAHDARYVDLDAGHFALLLRRREAEEAIGAWLSLDAVEQR